MQNVQYLLYLARKNQEWWEDLREILCEISTKLSIEQFSTWLKHCYAVKFLFFGSHSAQFLSFKLDSAPTESFGSMLPLRPILRPALLYMWTPLFANPAPLPLVKMVKCGGFTQTPSRIQKCGAWPFWTVFRLSSSIDQEIVGTHCRRCFAWACCTGIIVWQKYMYAELLSSISEVQNVIMPSFGALIRRVRQGVSKWFYWQGWGSGGVPPEIFLIQDTKKTPFWHTLIILYQFFRPSIAAQLAGLWSVKLPVLEPAEQHVCHMHCSSSGARLAKGENPWTPHVHRVYRGRQPVSPLPWSAPGLSSRLPHPHKVKKFPFSWCHEDSCLGETSLNTQAVHSELWASCMWHSSVLFPSMQSAPFKLGLRSQLESATTKESSLFSFGVAHRFQGCTLHCGDCASQCSGEHKRGRNPGLIDVFECWRKWRCRCALQRAARQRAVLSVTVQRLLHFQRVSRRWRALSRLLKLGPWQFVIGREMSWLTLTAVQGTLRKSETLRMLDRPVSVLEDRNARFSVSGKLWPASFQVGS